MQLFRFLLYCLSTVVGVVGLAICGWPLVSYAYQRLFLKSFTYRSDELFPDAVIVFLSLIVLMMVHFGHRHAGAFADLPAPESQDEDLES